MQFGQNYKTRQVYNCSWDLPSIFCCTSFHCSQVLSRASTRPKRKPSLWMVTVVTLHSRTLSLQSGVVCSRHCVPGIHISIHTHSYAFLKDIMEVAQRDSDFYTHEYWARDLLHVLVPNTDSPLWQPDQWRQRHYIGIVQAHTNRNTQVWIILLVGQHYCNVFWCKKNVWCAKYLLFYAVLNSNAWITNHSFLSKWKGSRPEKSPFHVLRTASWPTDLLQHLVSIFKEMHTVTSERSATSNIHEITIKLSHLGG